MGAWVVAGLPNDSFSIENGIIMDKAVVRALKMLDLSSGKLTICYWKLPFSSLIYQLKIVIFHSYVSLPEGNLDLWIFMVMSVGKVINQQFVGYHMFGEGFIYVFFPWTVLVCAGSWIVMDCCDLRLTSGQLARHIQTCPFNFGLWQKRSLFCGDTAGTTVPCSVWLSDERLDWGFWPHFWTDDGHLVLDPVEYILCTYFTLYFVYRIRRVSQKIRSYQHHNI